MATTNGFHKGLPLKSGFRILFTMNFLVHHELGQSAGTFLPQGSGVFYEGGQSPYSKRFKVSKRFYEQLEDDKKPLYDFMEKV